MRPARKRILATGTAVIFGVIFAIILLIATPLGDIIFGGATNSDITSSDITIDTATATKPSGISAPKNLTSKSPPAVILFIGDGMGEQHRTAARWASQGIDGQLHMDSLTYSGYTMTADAIGFVTDSAASATAIATGQKTYNGRLSLAPDLTPLPTILEAAQAAHMSVGLVTNSRSTTPLRLPSHLTG